MVAALAPAGEDAARGADLRPEIVPAQAVRATQKPDEWIVQQLVNVRLSWSSVIRGSYLPHRSPSLVPVLHGSTESRASQTDMRWRH